MNLPRVCSHLCVADVYDSAVPWPSGVLAMPLTRHTDARGFFMEVVRFTSFAERGFSAAQVSLSETVAGVTKAFHFHRCQTDLFCPIDGRFRIVLIDGRCESSTFGQGFSVYTDAERPFLLRIPPGVAHGYRVLGALPARMLYIMDREYDPSDEYRVDWDDPAVAFPWGDDNSA
mgnify:CR=1 FL=1